MDLNQPITNIFGPDSRVAKTNKDTYNNGLSLQGLIDRKGIATNHEISIGNIIKFVEAKEHGKGDIGPYEIRKNEELGKNQYIIDQLKALEKYLDKNSLTRKEAADIYLSGETIGKDEEGSDMRMSLHTLKMINDYFVTPHREVLRALHNYEAA